MYIDLMYQQLVLYFYVKIKKKHFTIADKLKLRMNKYKINKILIHNLTEFQDSRKCPRSNWAVKY